MNESRAVAVLRHWSAAVLVVLVAFGLATLLVVRLSTTLTDNVDVPGGLPGAGNVVLVSSVTDEDPIFDGSNVMEPGQSIQSCIAVDASTSGVNRGVMLDVSREAISDNPLARLLQVTVERGAGTFATSNASGECRGFRAVELVASGTLEGVVLDDEVPVWRPPPGEAEAHFRFTARLPGTADNDLVGKHVDDLVITFRSAAETGGPAWIDRSSLLLTSLALNRSAPVAGLVVLALFFSSLQALLSGDLRRESESVSDDRVFQPPSLA